MVEFSPNTRPEKHTETAHRPYRPVEREPVDKDFNQAREYDDKRPADDRSIADLFKGMTSEARLLLKQEVQLARVEMMGSVKAAAKDSAFIVAGGVVAYAGLLAIVAAAAVGLFVFMVWAGAWIGLSMWLAPLIVGGIVALIGYALYRSGMNRLRNNDMVPRRTTQTMRENAQWMKERTTK